MAGWAARLKLKTRVSSKKSCWTPKVGIQYALDGAFSTRGWEGDWEILMDGRSARTTVAWRLNGSSWRESKHLIYQCTY